MIYRLKEVLDVKIVTEEEMKKEILFNSTPRKPSFTILQRFQTKRANVEM